jgi:hypothetical protein
MYPRHALPALALLAAAIGCSDRDAPLPVESPGGGPAAVTPSQGAASREGQRLERQAQRLARALGDADFRRYVKAQLTGSPVAEHKLHFQRFLSRDGRRALDALGRAGAEGNAAVEADADAGITAELYFPVPGDLERWDGGPDLLVATAMADHDAPVAFDTRGRRRILSPDGPPGQPVLALVPNETDFDHPPGPGHVICGVDNCPDTGGGGTGGTGGTGGSGVPAGAPPVPSLRLGRAQFVDTYEGWLKGNPEFELHVLGPASATDTSNMVSYQCVGEHAPAGYAWDMNGTSWTGDVKVFGQDQMDALERTYPGRSYLILALEDDDTACEIKTGADRFGDVFTALKNAYQSYIGIKDIKIVTINGVVRVVGAAKSAASLINALANLIKSNDDLIGIAMADSIVGRASPVGHWAVMEGKTKVNGWLDLQIR